MGDVDVEFKVLITHFLKKNLFLGQNLHFILQILKPFKSELLVNVGRINQQRSRVKKFCFDSI